MFTKRMTLLAAGLALGGCATIEMITFVPSKNSFLSSKQIIAVGVPGTTAIDAKELALPGVPADMVALLRSECGVPPDPKADFGVSAAILVAGVLIDAGIAKAKEYAEKKAKEFTRGYAAKINVADFALPAGAGRTGARCVVLQRTIEMPAGQIDIPELKPLVTAALKGEVTPLNQDTKVRVPALTLAFKFERVGTSPSHVLKPILLDLNYAGARTSESGNTIDIDVSIGISTLRGRQNQLSTTLFTQQNFSFGNVALPLVKEERDLDDKGQVRWGSDGKPLMKKVGTKQPYDTKNFAPGTIIPPEAGSPATIVVAVVEKGDGADTFGDAAKENAASAGVWKTLALDGLKKLLGGE